jgi:FxsC-like protein
MGRNGDWRRGGGRREKTEGPGRWPGNAEVRVPCCLESRFGTGHTAAGQACRGSGWRELVLYFFMSHARGDDDPWVGKFFKDLAREVRIRSEKAGDVVGFLDTHSLKIGTAWEAELDDALSGCACFVALCSPRYFVSEMCGKEWSVFAARQSEYDSSYGAPSGALLPVNWLPVPTVHPAAAPYQNTQRQLGQNYEKLGLLPLIRLKRFKEDYLEVLFAFAERIIEVAHGHRLPSATLRLASGSVPSAFHSGSSLRVRADPAGTGVRSALPQTAVSSTPDAAEPASDAYDAVAVPTLTRRVQFVIAVGTERELRDVRADVSFYGADHAAWAPYRPAQDEPLAVVARDVAADRRFVSEIADTEGLMDRIDAAKRENKVVVLLVDAWATRLPRLSDSLRTYDRRPTYDRPPEPTTGVMIPFSNQDLETQQHHIELTGELDKMFWQHVRWHDDVMFVSNVATPDSFNIHLKRMLEVAQNRIAVLGPVYPPTFMGTPTSRPILEGPST